MDTPVSANKQRHRGQSKGPARSVGQKERMEREREREKRERERDNRFGATRKTIVII